MMQKTLTWLALAASILGCGKVETGSEVSSCGAPAADCNGDGTCEVQLDHDTKNCGACGHVCQSSSGAAPSCVEGKCTLECSANRGDCNALSSDGCEAILDHDPSNCGACGNVCSSNNTTSTCIEGKCVLECGAGYADCNGLAIDGCEAQLDIDPNHCGACGQSCGAWGDCFQSTCVEILATATAMLVGADALVVQGSDLYWSSGGVNASGLVARTPLAGGPTFTLSSQQFPDSLHSNGSSLVWSDWGDLGVYRMPIAGGAVQTLWKPPGAERPDLLEVDSTQAYFTTGTDVRAIPILGGEPTLLDSGFVDVKGAYLDGEFLYLADQGPEVGQAIGSGHPEGVILRINVKSGGVQVLAQHLDTPVAVITAGDSLFWAESGSMATYSTGPNTIDNFGTLGRVMRAKLDGSKPSVVADHLAHPVALARDDTHLYWAVAGTVGGQDPTGVTYHSDGSVMRAALAGGPPETVMPTIDARTVALSHEAVFFSSWVYGVIFKKKKP